MNGNLRRLREKLALSLTDLSRISGVHRVTINRIENGKQKPMPRTVRRLADALQVDVELLTAGEVTSSIQQEAADDER